LILVILLAQPVRKVQLDKTAQMESTVKMVQMERKEHKAQQDPTVQTVG
jgi:hypothetical protein